MLIKARVSQLLKNVKACPVGSPGWIERQNRLYKEMEAIGKIASDAALNIRQEVVFGRVLSFSVADGYANYIITRVDANEVVVSHVALGDAYCFIGVYLNRRGETVISRQVVERVLKMERIFEHR